MTHIQGQILIEDIVRDNHTFKFPLHEIQFELSMALVAQEEFFYLIQQANEKLKKKYIQMTSYIFLALVQMEFEEEQAESLPLDVYMSKMEKLIIKLSKISITRIPIDSPDYEIISEMCPI